MYPKLLTFLVYANKYWDFTSLLPLNSTINGTQKWPIFWYGLKLPKNSTTNTTICRAHLVPKIGKFFGITKIF